MMSPIIRRWQQALGDRADDGVQLFLLLGSVGIGLLVLVLYARTLQYSVTEIPVALQDLLPWQYPNLRPEPWEPHLYHVGWPMVLLAALVSWTVLQQWMRWRWSRAAALYSSALFAAAALIAWLLALHSFHPLTRAELSTLVPASRLAWGLAAVSAAVIVLRGKLKSIELSQRYLTALEILLVGGFILWIAYDPMAVIPFQGMNAGDYGWFLAPTQDVLSGKHLLVASQSQYGLLLFYLLAAIFRFMSIANDHFGAVLIVLHVLYYTLLYLILRTLLPNRTQAIVAFLFVMGFSFFSNEARSSIYGQPSISRLRNLLDAPIFLGFALELKTQRRFWFKIAAVLTGIAALYNMDVGAALLIAGLAFAVAVPLFTERSATRVLWQSTMRIGWIVGTVVFTVIGFTAFIELASGQFPAWSKLFTLVGMYVAGFGSLPMPVVGAYWWILAAYAAGLLTVFVSWVGKRNLREAPFILAVCVYGIVAFHYYLGRSYIGNLWVISTPALVCAALLASAYDRRRREHVPYDTLRHWSVQTLVLVLTAASLGSALSTTATTLAKMTRDRYLEPLLPLNSDPTFQADFERSIGAIQQRIGEGQRAAVFSNRDAIFTIGSNRANALQTPLIESVFTKSELAVVLLTFLHENHRYAFLDRKPDNCHVCDAVYPFVRQYYTLDRTEGLLDIYVRNDKPAPATLSFE